MQPNDLNRSAGESAGRSLAEMAQRDLDAALQLLADRAQFITGASGAAIALRRQGRNDMLCRASAGSNAPELGALLSTEFGLSGESVRTRQLLRCDDAERDARVNREVCRRLGIASVLVMPVVNDDEVLGVFELFSGKANAFGERDLSAVQRLGQMVETAVRLAQVTENLPEKLKAASNAAADAPIEKVEEQILEDQILDVAITEEQPLTEKVAYAIKPAEEVLAEVSETAAKVELESDVNHLQALAAETLTAQVAEVPSGPEVVEPKAVEEAPAPKLLFWSAASVALEPESASESDESHVPPVLRGLRKCEACGFPISGGRVLCVECEEKKWRGQLKRPQSAMPTGALPETPAARKSEGQAFAAAQAVGRTSVLPPVRATQVALVPRHSIPGAAAVEPQKAQIAATPAPAANVTVQQEARVAAPSSFTAPILSSGLDSSESWFSANKYVIGVLLLVAALLAAILLLR